MTIRPRRIRPGAFDPADSTLGGFDPGGFDPGVLDPTADNWQSWHIICSQRSDCFHMMRSKVGKQLLNTLLFTKPCNEIAKHVTGTICMLFCTFKIWPAVSSRAWVPSMFGNYYIRYKTWQIDLKVLHEIFYFNSILLAITVMEHRILSKHALQSVLPALHDWVKRIVVQALDNTWHHANHADHDWKVVFIQLAIYLESFAQKADWGLSFPCFLQ